MDQKLLFLINREWTSPAADRVMALLSSFPAWIPLIIALAALLLWRGAFRARALVVCAVVIIGINDGVISNSLKHLVHRPRPHEILDGVREVDLAKARPRILAVAKPAKIRWSVAPPDPSVVRGHSFPSSHTMNTIAMAVLVVCFYRRWGWLAFAPALGVAYSRIYTGSHWPSDVLVSVFLGIGCTLLLLALLAWLWATRGARALPKIHAAHPSLLGP